MVSRNTHDVKFTTRVTISPPFEHLARMFREKVGRALDVAGVLPAVADYMGAQVLRAFDSRGALVGSRWAPVRADYVKRKSREGHSEIPGVRTGGLREALAGMQVIRRSERSITVGLNRQPWATRAAAFHFGGGRFGKVPARPYFELSKAADAAIYGMIEKHIARQVAEVQL